MVFTATLKPSSDGSYQQNSVSSGTHWEAVKENDSLYIYTHTDSYLYDTFYCSPAVIPVNALISKVTLYLNIYAPVGGDGYGRLATYFDGVLRTHGGDTSGVVSWEFTTAPDGTPWLRSDLDSIQWGVTLHHYGSGFEIRCDYVYVVVEYILPTGSQAQAIGMMW